MPFRLSILGSGSGGNCTLLRLDGDERPRHLLIDLGFSPRETVRRLARHGIEPGDVEGVFLTHLDGDHLHRGWERRAESFGWRFHVHDRHRHAAVKRGVPVRAMDVFDEGVDLGDGARVTALALAHDQLGTVGYVVEHRGRRLGFATDLGRVPPHLFETFRDLHVLAIESNYDRGMQVDSDRPDFLKRRIMGGAGHLSNEQALAAARTIAAGSALSRLVLIHLSRQCNDAKRIAALYAREAPHLGRIVTIADQFEPTGMIPVEPGEVPMVQMALFGGTA